MTRRFRPLCLFLGPALALIACNVAPGDPLVAPDSPVLGVEARSAEGSLLVEVDGPLQWPWEAAVRIHIDAFDAEGGLIEEHWGLLTARGDDGEQRQVLWWPTVQRPAVLGVRILVDERVVFSHRVDTIGEVPVTADGRCDALGARDRCAPGHICWPADGGLGSVGRFEPADRFAGRCVAGQARAWRSDARFAAEAQFGAVDLRFPDAPDDRIPIMGSALYPEQGDRRRWWSALAWDPTDGSRAVLPLTDLRQGDPPATVDVYIGPHLFARGLPLEAPPTRRLGEACDTARTIDVCGIDTLCSEGRCVQAAAPRIVDVRAHGHQDGITVWFEGHDPEGDIVRYDISSEVDGQRTARFSMNALHAVRNWYPQAFGSGLVDGVIEADEGVQRARVTFDPRIDEPGRVEVTITATDAWDGRRSVTVEVEPAAPAPVDAGATCDPLAVEFACPEEHVCDVAVGAEVFACHALADPCPTPVTPLGPEGIEARWGDAPNPLDVFSCSGYIGEPETPREIHSYSYTAARAGDHRFIAEPRGHISAVSVRRRCDLPRTETGCGNTRYPKGFARLEAGETVHVVVQRPLDGLWEAAGWRERDEPLAYTLRVEVGD